MGTYTWTITPNDIDREIKVWQDRKSGKLKNGWHFLAFNYDAEQIINVLKYAKELNKSVLITSRNLFWKADIIYDNYGNNNTNNYNAQNIYINTNNNNNTKEGNQEKKVESSDKKEKPIAIIFGSTDQSIHFPVVCYNSDKFSEITKNLYIEYPELNKKDFYFIYDGDIINASETVEQNKLKNGSNILIHYN